MSDCSRAKIINSAWNDRKIGIRKLSPAVTSGPSGLFPVHRSPTVPCHADLNNDSSSRAINDYCCKLLFHLPWLSACSDYELYRRIAEVDYILFHTFDGAPWPIKNSLNSENDQLCAFVRRFWSCARQSRTVAVQMTFRYLLICALQKHFGRNTVKTMFSSATFLVISFIMQNILTLLKYYF